MKEKKNDALVIYNPINELLNAKRLTKRCITNLADNFIREIFLFSSGIKELITINALKMLIERIDKGMRELLTDIEKDTYKGVMIETVNGPTVLDFEQDPEYNRLNELLKQRKKHSDAAIQAITKPSKYWKRIYWNCRCWWCSNHYR